MMFKCMETFGRGSNWIKNSHQMKIFPIPWNSFNFRWSKNYWLVWKEEWPWDLYVIWIYKYSLRPSKTTANSKKAVVLNFYMFTICVASKEKLEKIWVLKKNKKINLFTLHFNLDSLSFVIYLFYKQKVNGLRIIHVIRIKNIYTNRNFLRPEALFRLAVTTCVQGKSG